MFSDHSQHFGHIKLSGFPIYWYISCFIKLFQITGQYSVLLPDGRVQTVTYSVRPETGFVVSSDGMSVSLITFVCFSGWGDLHWRSILWSRRWRWWWSPSWIRSWQIKTSDSIPSSQNQNQNQNPIWIRSWKIKTSIPSSHQKPEQELNSTNSKSHVNQAECAKSRTRHRHRVSNWHQEEHWCSLDWHWGGGGRVAAFLCGLAVLECNLFRVTS